MHQGEFGDAEVKEGEHFYFLCISKLILVTIVDLSLSLLKTRTKQAIAEGKIMRGNRTVSLSRDFSFLQYLIFYTLTGATHHEGLGLCRRLILVSQKSVVWCGI